MRTERRRRSAKFRFLMCGMRALAGRAEFYRFTGGITATGSDRLLEARTLAREKVSRHPQNSLSSLGTCSRGHTAANDAGVAISLDARVAGSPTYSSSGCAAASGTKRSICKGTRTSRRHALRSRSTSAFTTHAVLITPRVPNPERDVFRSTRDLDGCGSLTHDHTGENPRASAACGGGLRC